MKTLTVNGDALEFNGNTLSDLIIQLDLQNRRLAVEVNREIISKSAHAEFMLADGDIIEIVHAIGGG
jgi:sulfur carrier protein